MILNWFEISNTLNNDSSLMLGSLRNLLGPGWSINVWSLGRKISFENKLENANIYHEINWRKINETSFNIFYITEESSLLHWGDFIVQLPGLAILGEKFYIDLSFKLSHYDCLRELAGFVVFNEKLFSDLSRDCNSRILCVDWTEFHWPNPELAQKLNNFLVGTLQAAWRFYFYRRLVTKLTKPIQTLSRIDDTQEYCNRQLFEVILELTQGGMEKKFSF